MMRDSRALGRLMAAAGLAALLTAIPAGARLYQRVQPDGTVELYNHHSPVNTPRKKADLTSRFDPLIEETARKHSVDPQLVRCIIKVESNFNPDAVSVAGAMGLMQIMQEISQAYKCTDPMEPRDNLEAGIGHMAYLLKYFQNDVPLALAAYHAGLSRVSKNRSIPPIKSTMAYVNDVMSLYQGAGNYGESVKKLYQRIDRDGTIILYSN